MSGLPEINLVVPGVVDGWLGGREVGFVTGWEGGGVGLGIEEAHLQPFMFIRLLWSGTHSADKGCGAWFWILGSSVREDYINTNSGSIVDWLKCCPISLTP